MKKLLGIVVAALLATALCTPTPTAHADAVPPGAASTPAHLRVPETWSCEIPAGYTYVNYRLNASCYDGREYDIRVPTDMLWACILLTTFTYTSSRYSTACVGNRQFLTRRPVTGMWACIAPIRFSWTDTRPTTSCEGPREFLLKAL